MWRLIKFLLILAFLALVGLVIFAFVGPFVLPGDFEAPLRDVSEPVDLGLD